MAHFLLRLNGPRPTFPGDATDAERAVMGEHFAYWQGKADQGAAIAVGPVLDARGVWGMGLVEVEDLPAAQALASGDPVTLANLGFSYDISEIPSIIMRR